MPYATKTKGSKVGFEHGPSVKNSATYEALITERGMSKSKAAAISNAAIKKTGKRGRHHSAKRR